MGVQRDLERLGMATTLTMLVTDGRDVALGHLGDSRGYLFRDGALRQITKDHTYVQHLIDTGQLTAEDRAVHPWRNVVLRSVDGDPEGGGPDIVRLDVSVGDRLLLASDGLTDLVSDDEIADVLATEGDDEARADAHRAGAGRGRPRQHHRGRRRPGRRARGGRRRPAARRTLRPDERGRPRDGAPPESRTA